MEHNNQFYKSINTYNKLMIHSHNFYDTIIFNEYDPSYDYDYITNSYYYNGRFVTERRYWDKISTNPKAIKYIMLNINYINMGLFIKYNPNAYMVLLTMPELINFDLLQKSKFSSTIYKYYPHKITWEAVHNNPRLDKYINTDYNTIKWGK